MAWCINAPMEQNLAKYSNINWDDLKIFLAAAEAPSMRLAAGNMGVSHSTISRRIDALEKELGVRLFDRLSDGYRLTEAGSELLPIAHDIDERVNTFGRQVAGRDKELKGQITVTMPLIAANCMFMPMIIEFMEEYPSIDVKVTDSFKVLDLSRREADIAIRFTNNPPEHLIGRKLGTLHQAAYATQAYLDQHDPHATDSTAKWVGWGKPHYKPAWVERSPFPHLPLRGHFDSVELQIAAMKAGVGVGYVPCIMTSDQSGFVQLSEPEPWLDVWLLSHRDLRTTARMRAFRQFITDRIPAIQAAFEGKSRRQAA